MGEPCCNAGPWERGARELNWRDLGSNSERESVRMPRVKKELAGRTKPPGIREIALSLGISIGTVDRALHNRPGINGETRRRILKRAQALGYRPNLAARFLSSQKQ